MNFSHLQILLKWNNSSKFLYVQYLALILQRLIFFCCNFQLSNYEEQIVKQYDKE